MYLQQAIYPVAVGSANVLMGLGLYHFVESFLGIASIVAGLLVLLAATERMAETFNPSI